MSKVIIYLHNIIFRLKLNFRSENRNIIKRDIGYEKKNFHYFMMMMQSRHPSMACAMHMTRLWISRNMFDPHILPDLIDLLFIFIYEGDLTKRSPKTPFAGKLYTFFF